MQKIIAIIFVIFFLIACGAQNKTSEEETLLEDSLSNTSMQMITLPQTIAIDFPSVLSSVNNDSFVENIESIKIIINIEKEKLKLLEEVIDTIRQECKGLTTCHIEANQSIVLGEIDFMQFPLGEKYQYELKLNISHQMMLTFKWSDFSRDILTIYKEENHQLKMHYFSDDMKNKEAVYIADSKNTAQNSLMISLNRNNGLYRFRSNNINANSSFSSNILVQDEVLLEENENIYDFNNNFSNIEEGAYLLFSSSENADKLNLLELFEKSLGSFLVFDNKLQGFTYKNLESEAVIPLRITAED